MMGFALSWLTLRSGSVLPATLAHWLYNMGVYSRNEPDYPGSGLMATILWASVAYTLFRFWPVEDKIKGELDEASLEPEPNLSPSA